MNADKTRAKKDYSRSQVWLATKLEAVDTQIVGNYKEPEDFTSEYD